MKTAVLISGQMRTAAKCYQNIKQYLPKDSDYFIYTSLDSNYTDAELFDPVRLIVEPQHEQPERKEYSWQLNYNCFGVQVTLKQLYGLKKVWDVFQAHKNKYDFVVRCRSDIQFKSLIMPASVHDLDIFIPKFSNWRGLNDQFAVLSIKSAEIYFKRFDLLDHYINEGGVFHPETFLLWICQKNNLNIHRVDTTYNIVREDGSLTLPVYEKQFGDILQ